jgi:hypothetical protein
LQSPVHPLSSNQSKEEEEKRLVDNMARKTIFAEEIYTL